MQNSKQYDLEDRTKKFAIECRKFIYQLSKTTGNYEDGKQLVRSSGSQAANYIEANEALSKKDFIMRIKICRKEAKESQLWLSLIDIGSNQILQKIQEQLLQEAKELTKIFGSILEKSK
ncbi:four helix bundle protein [Candidatus Berkelbacteria bacterium CG_4_8_14_3_um_filter_33_6]|uniref:Four helix bundle protein n=1 Tax=Candidatus Berkelbacteria bacterium CG_4_10_14_0_2_um_filter_35_9_33_12 TaxID=1974499 RepID=A0A2M7W4F8_9BACT|nr:MAG: four helix bundle protein [Candidatus Berkelbacteria bacterium CG23_combo_of_CG06-09_8_20_14_all_33_15]PIS08438.1 MAG: four helix bundle protein [Candidatus Berkelbacteria bacterium CG10_big_fil_rev_8_21_14_0_10_33_10]PIX31067.1 MAG: four helix bundle protein [Candidatus Berkelbacteria bacterium CG_4_8_14_3_um_filter_33_6]PIZ27913.1 MAG: four helix bundle protein [Candidatus Berkelbacteria bacterium CG_4_10_14_0_8_um_filter_35_9_33_8]PJA20685.1 MAG: four helix bundle protein [Candidatus